VGGVNIPAAVGRLSGTLPVGVLELTGRNLVFGVRPHFLQRLFGVKELATSPDGNIVIFPVRRLVGMGIGFQQQNEPIWYFWTNAGNSILAALARAGFEVSQQVQDDPRER
jgi:hypothetical protein